MNNWTGKGVTVYDPATGRASHWEWDSTRQRYVPLADTREPDTGASRRAYEAFERETDEATRLNNCF